MATKKGKCASKSAKKKSATKTVKKVKCAAKTKEGKKCKNYATGKSKFCSSHKK